MNDTSNAVLSEALESALTAHLNSVRTAIKQRAQELAQGERLDDRAASEAAVEIGHLARAINEYAPGRAVTSVAPAGVWQRFLDSVSPVTIISAVLTIIFAAFGLWAILGPEAAKGGGVQGAAYLDIAKIFAGAIVGSASVAVASAVRTANPPLQRTRDKAARR